MIAMKIVFLCGQLKGLNIDVANCNARARSVVPRKYTFLQFLRIKEEQIYDGVLLMGKGLFAILYYIIRMLKTLFYLFL